MDLVFQINGSRTSVCTRVTRRLVRMQLTGPLPEFLTELVGGGTQELAFLTSSGGTGGAGLEPHLLHFEHHCSKEGKTCFKVRSNDLLSNFSKFSSITAPLKISHTYIVKEFLNFYEIIFFLNYATHLYGSIFDKFLA